MVLSLDQDCEYRYVLVRRTIKTNHTNTYDGRWRRVSRRYGIPLMGLILSTTVCSLLGLIYFGRYVCPKPFFLWMYSNEKKKKKKSSAAFNSFTGVATICLSTSYGLPILVSVLRGRKLVKNAPFSLGKFGMTINLLSIIWILLAYVPG